MRSWILSLTSLAGPVALLSIARFVQYTAHLLWGRIDYESWVFFSEVTGHSQLKDESYRAGNKGGKEMSGKVFVTPELQVEIYVVKLRSIAFGIDGTRVVTGFTGDLRRAGLVRSGLRAFIERHGDQADRDTARKLGDINREIRGKGQLPKDPPTGRITDGSDPES